MRGWRISGCKRRRALIAGAALVLASCGERGEVYQRPPAEVRELLRTVEVPLYMFGDTAETDAVVDASDPAKIVWKITVDGSPLMRFSATVAPQDETGTRVVVDLVGSNSNKFGDVEARLAKAREVRALYLASMTEAVDSTLDGRAYDITATYPALMAATTANLALFTPPPSNKDKPS